MPKGATPVISVFILGGAGKQKNLASLRDILRKNCTLTLIGEQQIDIQKEFVQIEFEGALNMLSDALLTGQWKFHFEVSLTNA